MLSAWTVAVVCIYSLFHSWLTHAWTIFELTTIDLRKSYLEIPLKQKEVQQGCCRVVKVWRKTQAPKIDSDVVTCYLVKSSQISIWMCGLHLRLMLTDLFREPHDDNSTDISGSDRYGWYTAQGIRESRPLAKQINCWAHCNRGAASLGALPTPSRP